MANNRRLGEAINVKEELIKKACLLAFKAHNSPDKPYEKSRSSSEIIFSFPGCWSARDWFTQSSFGERKVDLGRFPSLKSIGNEEIAIVNKAFLNRFEGIFDQLRSEVEKAMKEKKPIVFTGHSSGGPIAVLMTIRCLEISKTDKSPIHCFTFGSPLVGDRIFNHALNREAWSQHFTHFVTRYDIFPRVPLAPPDSTADQLEHVLQFLNPKRVVPAMEPIQQIQNLYVNVMRNASVVASNSACHLMGNTNKLIDTLSSFIDLSPYRPSGTYVFCTGNGRLVVVKNTDAILQILFYSSQLSPGVGLETSRRSVEDHFNYQSEIQNLETKAVTVLDKLEGLPLSSSASGGGDIEPALTDLGLSTKARLSLCAAGATETQRLRNLAKEDNKRTEIEKLLKWLEDYKTRCEVRQMSYYDAFKASKEHDDFHANVKRLELAGLWDEIMEMLKKDDLPDEFEGYKSWCELGTRYRYIAEPLDIANYYRHLKNEDTGPYLSKGRPRRYRYTQKWLEYADSSLPKPCLESCFWAELEELIQTSNAGDLQAVEDKVLLLEKQVQNWLQNNRLGEDIFFENSTFVNWWNSLPQQLTSNKWFSTALASRRVPV